MDQGAIHFGNYKVMLNNFSTETYLQEGILSSLRQTVSCEPNDAFLIVNVREAAWTWVICSMAFIADKGWITLFHGGLQAGIKQGGKSLYVRTVFLLSELGSSLKSCSFFLTPHGNSCFSVLPLLVAYVQLACTDKFLSHSWGGALDSQPRNQGAVGEQGWKDPKES